ncbi:MAG TPA: SDR family oxidoreductase [Solirubrobacterales bacterium]|jgi:3-oxoacyl-[acyl-carrier protein] reductase
MAERAALVTGGSSGIGLAIARALLDAGCAVTIASRRPEKLARAAAELREGGGTVTEIAADLATEQGVIDVVAGHREAHGRLDVLVNSAGLGIGGPIEDVQAKHIDLQYALNLKAIILFYRESAPMLREAGAEHRKALVVNVSSITGKQGHEWLSAYSAIKHGVVGLTQAMNRELNDAGIKSCVLCPAYVDTELSDYKKSEIPAEEMITTEDVAGFVGYLVGLSKNCVIPEVMFERPGELV